MERVEIHFDTEIAEDVVFRNAWMPNFQARRVGDSWFLSNVAGGWLTVSDGEYEQLSSVAVPWTLFRKAEQRHLILTAANTTSFFNGYSRWTTPHFRHPTHHIIVSTLRCNLACTYCHVAVVPPDFGPEYDLTTRTADAILEFALNSKAEVQSFEFQGGESLLNKDVLFHAIPRIKNAYRAAGKEVAISLQTNATLLNDQLVAFFREHDVSVGTSVDGPQQVHDAQRVFVGGRGSYGTVTKKAAKYDLPVLPTVTNNSVAAWTAIVDMQLARGAKTVTFQNVYPINSAASNWSQVGITAQDFLEIYDAVAEYLRSLWAEGYYPLERRFRLALTKLYTGRDVDYADFGNPCGMIHSQIAYNLNGDIYTCDEGRDFPEFRLGNVFTDTYDEVVFGRRARQLKTLSLPNDPECQTCAYRPVCTTCPVYDRATTGEVRAVHAGTDKCRQTIYIYDKLLSWLADDSGLLEKLAHYHGLTH
jgi:radical SAM protein with 4Fe4S-binding SPASM domain